MIRINDILDTVLEFNAQADISLIDKAYIYSAKVHAGQVRLNGEPYLSHPLAVASILAELRLDPVSIAAGLLHDVVEDTHATEEEIREMFGDEVTHIVAGVTKLSKVQDQSAEERHAESIRKMLLAMADDLRVILIKLADRLHNMRTLEFHRKEEKKRKISQETLDIYAPIASRLGIHWIKKELEDTAFRYIHPEEFTRIKGKVSKDQEEREDYVATVRDLISQELATAGLKGEVTGRYKHFFSIYKKMQEQNLAFEDVYDIIAFRIILDTKPQCYEALGLIHALWKPIDIKFKDYIGRPKPNMYQSLHTTVIGPFGERVEIQIRTWEMDRVAKSGIAAHWSYKEGQGFDARMTEKFAWIQNLIENQAEVQDPEEFMETVRIDLFPDEVYVYTPNGEIKSLVKGSTPIDFAYLIHTEVGNQCVGAKVNRRMVTLRHELSTGDMVEIITNKNAHPSKDWLNFVKTSKARNRIRQWIKTQEKERSITLGRELCDKEFRKQRLNYATAAKSEEMEQVIADFGFKTLDDLIGHVGYGKITPLQVLKRYRHHARGEEEAEEREEVRLFDRLINRVRKKRPRSGVMVKGLDDVLVKFGKCCNPVPGDPITGYITRGQGVTVHRTSCVNARQMNPERQIEVSWTESSEQETFPVKVRVLSHDRVGLLADVATNISKQGANILNVHSEIREDKTVESVFTVAVKNTDHMHRLLTAIKKVRMIIGVTRIDL
jgi:GTP pyrophosphokinase